jgi:hypothetical protein
MMEELQFDETSLHLLSFIGKTNKSTCKKRILKANMETMTQYCAGIQDEFPATQHIVFSIHAFPYFMDKMSRYDLGLLGITFDDTIEKGIVRLLNE